MIPADWLYDNIPQAFKDITVGQVMGGVAVVALLVWLGKRGWKFFGGLKDRWDDIFGEKSRDGVDRRPGLVERQAAIERAVEEIRYHVQPNGGNSAHDHMRDRVEQAAVDAARAASTSERNSETLSALTKILADHISQHHES